MTEQTVLPGLVESVQQSFSRARAIYVASRLKSALLKHCVRDRSGAPLCRIAGSLRRRCRDVHDIDIVAVVSTAPEDTMNLQSNPRSRLRADLEKRCDEVLMWGPDRARLVVQSIPVDLFFTKPKTFPVALVTSTGGSRHILKLTSRARQLGLRYHTTRHLLQDHDGAAILIRTEQEFYERLRLDFVPPERRS